VSGIPTYRVERQLPLCFALVNWFSGR